MLCTHAGDTETSGQIESRPTCSTVANRCRDVLRIINPIHPSFSDLYSFFEVCQHPVLSYTAWQRSIFDRKKSEPYRSYSKLIFMMNKLLGLNLAGVLLCKLCVFSMFPLVLRFPPTVRRHVR